MHYVTRLEKIVIIVARFMKFQLLVKDLSKVKFILLKILRVALHAFHM